MDKKGQIENIQTIIFIVILVTVIISAGFFIVQEFLEQDSLLDTQKTVTNEVGYINNTGYTLNDASVTAFNSLSITQAINYESENIWLECDGTNDLIILPLNSSISFWYKNATTTNWQHVINSSDGETYVNGSTATPKLQPFYSNDTNYILCKKDSTTFTDVDIDEIRLYNGTINSSMAEEIYDAGR